VVASLVLASSSAASLDVLDALHLQLLLTHATGKVIQNYRANDGACALSDD
jgi:hypothetical protein